MARGSSKSSGSTRNRKGDAGRDQPEADVTAETVTPETDSVAAAPDDAPAPSEQADMPATDGPSGSDTPMAEPVEMAAGADTPAAGEAGDDSLAASETSETATAPETADSAIVDAETVPVEDAQPAAAAPEPARAPRPARGGFVPLLLGGVVAAGIGYGAAYFDVLPTPGASDDQSAAIAAALDAQSATLASLQARVEELAAAEPVVPDMPQPVEVDLSPVLDEIAGLSARLDAAAGSLTALTDRVTILEERPVFTGNLDADSAAALEAAAELEAELAAQREAAEARAAELEAEAAAAAAAAEQAAADAAAAIAAAEAEAQAAAAEAAALAARAAAEAALGQVQVALETGAPFAEPLAAVAGAAEVPAGLAAAADSGVATLEALQEAFPTLARAALPVALQETAGEGMGDRLGAFVMGQIGGRSVEPREGDDPDAVLSRVEAAVRAGDLPTALTEAAALPEGAQAVLAPWIADVEARAAAEEGLAALTAALATGN
ncbi:COG4223 family protein [Roseicyclus persicicus]|uniref:COG4223 family protein n=1 Tax=Roseicyclus persicicus TaxID=2650661 RepID=UPI001B350E6A|nr:hypothetical protein [Roseibacterium persicicum]